MDNLISKRSATERLIIAKTLLESVLQDTPSAQPQITYCAECIHWKHSDVRKNYCEVFDWINTAEDFCSFAERRSDG